MHCMLAHIPKVEQYRIDEFFGLDIIKTGDEL